jgi:serine/threonine protein phosphatase PrpC
MAGCTAVVALHVGQQLFVANAGDSRGVLCRRDGQAFALSYDHKPQQVSVVCERVLGIVFVD